MWAVRRSDFSVGRNVLAVSVLASCVASLVPMVGPMNLRGTPLL